jgi:hypothetical protein
MTGGVGAMMNETDVLRDVAARLEQAGLEYMLTGSVALSYYAQPRLTRDLDLVVALTEGDAGRVAALFEPDYYVPQQAMVTAIARRSVFNLIHNESVIKVDFVVLKGEAYRQQEFARRRRVSLGDFEVWIVSKEDLILSKLYWAKDSGSELQLRDVRNLLSTGYDDEYVSAWAEGLGVTHRLKECLPDE